MKEDLQPIISQKQMINKEGMKVIEVPIGDLKPSEYNPRQMTEKQAKDLTESIKEFGLVDPLIVNKHKGRENIVIGGHQRLKIASILGFKEIPVVYVDLDEKRERELNLRLNRNLGEWNYDLLANFSEEELNKVGFSSEELDKIFQLDAKEDDFDAEAEAEKIKEPKVKYGEIYQLGNHRLGCLDATKESDVKLLMGGEKADLIFTDPPYNVGYDYWGFRGTRKKGFISKKIFNDKKKPEEYQRFIKDSFQNAFDFSKDYSSFYCWHGIRLHELVKAGLQEAGWYICQTIIWLKNSLVLSLGQDYHRIYEPCLYGWKKGQKHFIQRKTGTKWSDVIILDREDFQNYFDVWWEHRDKIADYKHPTQKPVRLAERALKRHSERGFIVYEPFLGSGSTLVACEQLQRKCYGIELDPKFCQVIINRWQSLTQQKAKKL